MLKKSLVLAAATLILGTFSVAYAADTATTTAKKGKLFEQSDTNSDGAISKEEFVANAQKRFDSIDANHDGKLTKEEFKAKKEAMKEKRAARKDAAAEKAITTETK